MGVREIEERLLAIQNELKTGAGTMTEAEVQALDDEVTELQNKRAILIQAENRRKAILNGIAERTLPTEIIENMTKPLTTPQQQDNSSPAATAEFRNAWLKRIRGVQLTEAEERAYSTATGTGAEIIPTQTANEIISKIRANAPLLTEITLLQVQGNVKFAVEGTNNAATLHPENATITAASDTLLTVSLNGYEIVKLVIVSESVKTMSISTFESWLTDMLASSIAKKINELIINGTGERQPKGINYAQIWDDDNSMLVKNTEPLTAANVQSLIGKLPAGYDANAKFVMSKRTLFTDFLPLQDNGKNHIVTVQNSSYFIYGYPVVLSDDVATHEAFLGDMKKYVGNLGEAINVRSAYNIDSNNYKYSGVAIFDGTPAIGEAFVKLVKAVE